MGYSGRKNLGARGGFCRLFMLLLLLSWFFCFPQAHAESLDQLTEGADVIVMAVPVQKASFWQNGLIKTRALLEVEQVVFGERVNRKIPVLYDGGVVGSIGLMVSHGVFLPAGQKVLLFLVDRGGYFSVYHEGAGVFFVRSFDGKEIVIPAEEIRSRPGMSVRSLREEGEGIPLESFLSRVRHLCGERP